MKNQCIGISKSERCTREAILYNKMVCKSHYYTYRNSLEKNKKFPVYNEDALKDMENYIRENPNNSIIRIRKTPLKKKAKKKYISDFTDEESSAESESESTTGFTDEESSAENNMSDDEGDLSSVEFDLEDIVIIDDNDVVEYEEKIKDAMKKLSMALKILKG